MDDFMQGQSTIQDEPALDERYLSGSNNLMGHWRQPVSHSLSNKLEDYIDQRNWPELLNGIGYLMVDINTSKPGWPAWVVSLL
jgi:hypothetical protein